MRHYVITFKKGRRVVAEIEFEDYDVDRRSLAAASLLAGERVGNCVVASAIEGSIAEVRFVPAGWLSHTVDQTPIAAAIKRSRRTISSDDLDRYLEPRCWMPSSAHPDLFGAYV